MLTLSPFVVMSQPFYEVLSFLVDTVLSDILLSSFIEINRYICLPIFFPIFKHFTIIVYRFCKKKNWLKNFFLSHT